MKRHEIIVSLFPILLLISAALLHFYLVYKYDFSVWYGGGFGMFANLDGPSMRFLTVTETTDGITRKIALEDYFEDVRRITVFPRRRYVTNLLQTLCKDREAGTTMTAELNKIDFRSEVNRVVPQPSFEVTFVCE